MLEFESPPVGARVAVEGEVEQVGGGVPLRWRGRLAQSAVLVLALGRVHQDERGHSGIAISKLLIFKTFIIRTPLGPLPAIQNNELKGVHFLRISSLNLV